MNHAITRATILPEVIRLITNKYNISDFEALDRFYLSSTGASFADDETGLYGQSALYVFGLFSEEMNESDNDFKGVDYDH